MTLQGKNIWITGSSGGIGLALAKQAVKEKAACVMLSGSKQEKLQQAVAECLAVDSSVKVLSHCFDISKTHEIKLAVEAVQEQLPHIDILINNAGMSQRSSVLNTVSVVERYLMEVNFWGAVELSRLLLPQMLENGRGYIGVTSSVTGLFGVPLRSSYCASKHALHGYFTALLSEYYKQGIRVTILCPGKVNTQISKSALRGDGSALGIMERGHETGISAERCASIFWRALKRQKLLVYAAKSELIAVWLHRISLGLGAFLIRKVLPLREDSDSSK